MYLKRLELVGFKSFAQKTVLEFPAGIAAVVGPNGSGKSNIIDAVRWILGEREAKNMRGLRVEDLIFAGTPQRPRVGVAQATIVFDNRNHFFPTEYAEVSVRRRLERDGTAQQFLNDAEVRLKDVIDFFAKSRLGTRGFSIINQGDSDLFVRSNPKERRAMLEEILGLREYQLKKHDAELKLKSTKFNMEKARGLIDEIVPHLRLLRRQKTRWEKHDELAKELHELEGQYFSTRIQELERDAKKIEPELKRLEASIAEKKAELVKLERELENVRGGKPKGSEKLGLPEQKQRELSLRRAAIERELGRIEAQVEIFAGEGSRGFEASELVRFIEEIRETIEDVLYEANVARIKTLLKSLFEKTNHLLEGGSSGVGKRERRAELDEAKGRLAEELSDIEKRMGAAREAERSEHEQLKRFNEVFRHAFELVEAKKADIAKLETASNKLMLERERIAMKREELSHEAWQGGRKLEEFAGVPAPEGSRDLEWIAATERRIFKLRAELAGIGDIDSALVKEAEEMEARHEFLSGQIRDLEGAFKDLTDLVHELDRKIRTEFTESLKAINGEFQKYFRMMFGGGQGKLALQKAEIRKEEGEPQSDMNREKKAETGENGEERAEEEGGIEISVSIPTKRITSLDMLSGGEKSLVSLAVLFALISVSPPPFLVLDEVDAALDDANTRRFADLIREFSKKTQFLVVTHNRATMEAADILYGITMGDDGVSKVLSLKLE